MITVSESLAARRARLVAQAAAQRVALSGQMQPWRVRLAVADRVVAAARTAAARRGRGAAGAVAAAPRRAMDAVRLDGLAGGAQTAQQLFTK